MKLFYTDCEGSHFQLIKTKATSRDIISQMRYTGNPVRITLPERVITVYALWLSDGIRDVVKGKREWNPDIRRKGLFKFANIRRKGWDLPMW